MQAWLILLVAGLLQTGWAVGLKYTDVYLGESVSLARVFFLTLLLLAIIGLKLTSGAE